MLTSRGKSMLIIAVVTYALGLSVGDQRVGLVGIALILWIGLNWLMFLFKCRRSGSHILLLRRHIDGSSRSQVTTSIDQTYAVRLTAVLPARLIGLDVRVEELVPRQLALVRGSPTWQPDASAPWESGSAGGGGRQMVITYQFRPSHYGTCDLPGIHMQINDTHGFFERRSFLLCRTEITVLPFPLRRQTTSSIVKRNNVQILSGQHQYRRAGLGAELLGIRDYVPGDSPRTIAWKPSARLGKLLTCEFESDVPICATLLVDLGLHQFVGRPGLAPADRVITAAASIARLLLSDRDPVAAVIAGESGTTRIGHGSGERQMTRLLQRLLATPSTELHFDSMDIDVIVERTYLACLRRFPDLFKSHVLARRGGVALTNLRLARRKRRQLSLVFEHLFQLPVGRSVPMGWDDRLMRQLCKSYHQRYPSSLGPGEWPPELTVIERARQATAQHWFQSLLQAHARAHDNELFVLIGSLPTDSRGLNLLENVARVVRAAHHRLMFVETAASRPWGEIYDSTASQILYAADEMGRQQTHSIRARQQLQRLGCHMTRIHDPRLMQQVAAEIQLISSGRVRAASGRSSWPRSG